MDGENQGSYSQEVPGEMVPSERKAQWRKLLLVQERQLYEDNDKNLFSALLALPGRSSALLTVSGAVSTILASAAVFGSSGWLGVESRFSRAWVLIPFVIVLLLVATAVYLVLGTLAPVNFAEFQPDPTFVEDAINDLESYFDGSSDAESEIEDYMTDIASERVKMNSEKLSAKHRSINSAIGLLRAAFAISIVLFATVVIIKSGEGSQGMSQLKKLESKETVLSGGNSAPPAGSTAASKANDPQKDGVENASVFVSPRSGRKITSGRIKNATELYKPK